MGSLEEMGYQEKTGSLGFLGRWVFQVHLVLPESKENLEKLEFQESLLSELLGLKERRELPVTRLTDYQVNGVKRETEAHQVEEERGGSQGKKEIQEIPEKMGPEDLLD